MNVINRINRISGAKPGYVPLVRHREGYYASVPLYRNLLFAVQNVRTLKAVLSTCAVLFCYTPPQSVKRSAILHAFRIITKLTKML